ncbi:hypothetical protein M5K25_007373 [Dendrobium thyrsiflorum]|uniref:Uncharacterized protein n=1 Tax=Dendrobium thyrsiflorum TaxID=117978 RepID=A0ABD0VKP1_DENTH
MVLIHGMVVGGGGGEDRPTICHCPDGRCRSIISTRWYSMQIIFNGIFKLSMRIEERRAKDVNLSLGIGSRELMERWPVEQRVVGEKESWGGGLVCGRLAKDGEGVTVEKGSTPAVWEETEVAGGEGRRKMMEPRAASLGPFQRLTAEADTSEELTSSTPSKPDSSA